MGHAIMPCKWPVNCIDVINNIDGMNHMFQVSMDAPSTNWKFLETLQKDGMKKKQYELIDIWSCSLYVIHDTPARREDFIALTVEKRFPLFFFATWWVEDTIVTDRLTEIWDNIIKIVRHWEKSSKRKYPSSKSFLNAQQAASD